MGLRAEMTRNSEGYKPAPEVIAVAKRLYDLGATLYEFRIDWEDTGNYRKMTYYLLAEEAIKAVKEHCP